MDEQAIDIVRRVSYPIELWIDRSYRNSSKVHIAHDVDASVVDQETYYKLRTSQGGTRVAPAYQLALEIILKEHKGKDIYVTHLTDGDVLLEQDGPESCSGIENLLKEVNQFSLIQVPHRGMNGHFQSKLVSIVREHFQKNMPPSLFISIFKGSVVKVMEDLFGVKNASR